jgi:hypothetical protein
MRLGDVAHKNFFVAKNADSEFARRVFEPRRRAATSHIEFVSQLTLIVETPVAQWFPVTLTNASAAISRVTRIAARMIRGIDDEQAPRALPREHQHFLKPDAVFLSALVYSECSAFRFPSARSD